MAITAEHVIIIVLAALLAIEMVTHRRDVKLLNDALDQLENGGLLKGLAWLFEPDGTVRDDDGE